MKRPPEPVDSTRPLRIAYLGPTPADHGGVAGAAWLTLIALARLGHAVDCYLVDNPLDVGPSPHPGIRYNVTDHKWRWHRWYSRHPLTAMVSWQIAAAAGRRRAISVILGQQRTRPYDVLYQFSTIETFGIAAHAPALPPLVLHPQVHAQGELRSMWRERRLTVQIHQTVAATLVAGCLAIRVRRQRHSIRRADHIIAISETFAGDLIRDYRVPPRQLTVIPSPIASERFNRPNRTEDGIVRIAVVGRISVRKGLDDVVALSHRLDDLAGAVKIIIYGGHSLWSDYRALLEKLNPALAEYCGQVPWEFLTVWLPTCDIFLQPASYEPFGLTLGEALASGLLVVTTRQGRGRGGGDRRGVP
jgi:glycosyltransferase involved in cell wall biosynthesis